MRPGLAALVALRGRSFARLRGDGSMIGAPVDAVGGDWPVARGPFDPRVSPDGKRIAYWFTGRRRFCLPIEPSCSLQDTDVSAYADVGRVTDPLELGAVRDARKGTLRLRVPLNRRARRVLARRDRLALRLRVAVCAPERTRAIARRSVTLRAVKVS